MTYSRARVRSDRVDHQPRLVREEREAEAHVGHGDGDVRAHGPQVAALGDALPARQQSRQDGQRRGDDQRPEDEGGPHGRRHGRERPGRDEGGQRERGGHRPAQVVDHLPAGDTRDGAPAPPARGIAGAAEDPWQELPVAAGPAVLACRRDQVVRRELVEELDVGHQPGPGEDALEQVMAQERVLGYAVRHRRGEGFEVVDPLAGEAPFLEQVLVDVGHGGRIRVDAGRPGEGPPEDRCLVLGRERRRDPWLEHAVALGHPAGPRIEGRVVQRMGHRPHEAPHRAPGQPRVGVERDHVAHVRRRGRRGPPRGQDAGRRRSAQEGIQLLELAALALPPHPAALGLVPRSLPVEEQESGASPGRLAVALVEPVDGRRRRGQELVVAGDVLGRGIEPVRQQGEPEIALAVPQVVDLQAADLGLDVRLAGEEHRHDNQGPQPGRHAIVEVEAGQRSRAQHVGDRPVRRGPSPGRRPGRARGLP